MTKDIINHLGENREEYFNAALPPIFSNSNFLFSKVEDMREAMISKNNIPFYTRGHNPTTKIFEKKIAALESTESAIALSSGMAAISTAILSQVKSGEHMISVNQPYTGTDKLMKEVLPNHGIEISFIDGKNTVNFSNQIKENTKVIYLESPNSWTYEMQDLEEISKIAKKNKLISIIDNSFSSPINCNPAKWGIDIIIHSATKYIGGHGTSIGGIIIDSGNFDWTRNPARQPLFNTPDPSYHGAVWGSLVPEALGAPIAYAIRARVVLLRDLGAAISPANAFQLIQGLETLPLRYRVHQDNASRIAAHLNTHANIEAVIYPGLFSGAEKAKADKYLQTGYGPIVGIELKGGEAAGRKFIDNLQMIYHVANIGDARSLAIHPASTTHSQLSAEDQLKAGVTPGYVRLSIGIEHYDDIVADIEQALAAAHA